MSYEQTVNPTNPLLRQVCLTSNMNTLPELRDSPRGLRDHALVKMLEADISVTLSTDNRTVSRTNMTGEYEKVLFTLLIFLNCVQKRGIFFSSLNWRPVLVWCILSGCWLS